MEKPILFSTAMVQAILAGRKTATRRIIKPQIPEKGLATVVGLPCFFWKGMQFNHVDQIIKHCPYGRRGDRLWVQEDYSLEKTEIPSYYICKYSDGDRRTIALDLEEETKLLSRKTPITKKQPGRFMYKSCSRIWLEVKNVRVEKLQDITEEGAIAEGMYKINLCPGKPLETSCWSWENYPTEHLYDLPRTSFWKLWESIHGVESWNSNPFVWVVEFERVEVV